MRTALLLLALAACRPNPRPDPPPPPSDATSSWDAPAPPRDAPPADGPAPRDAPPPAPDARLSPDAGVPRDAPPMDAPPPPPPDAPPQPPPAPICVPPKLSAAELASGSAVVAWHPGYGYASTLCGPHSYWSWFWFEALVFRSEAHARAILGAAMLDPNFFRYRPYPKHCKVRRSPCTHIAPS